MKLQEGILALDFSAKDIFGNDIKLSSYKGRKIILSFYRNVSCPFCNRRIHQIMGHNLRLKQSDTQMILLFESTQEKLLSSVFHQGISPWPLIGDPDKNIYKQYRIESSISKVVKSLFTTDMRQATKYAESLSLPTDKDASLTLIPADFFIDENFKIVKAHYGRNLDDHVSLDDLKSFARI